MGETGSLFWGNLSTRGSKEFNESRFKIQDSENTLSITIAIEKPKSGAGLNHWNFDKHTADEMTAELGSVSGKRFMISFTLAVAPF